MGVDQILQRMPGRTATAWFSAFLTKCHWSCGAVNQN